MNDLPQQQDALRDSVYDLQQRWRDMQDRIRWAEQRVRRATTAACKANERRILSGQSSRG